MAFGGVVVGGSSVITNFSQSFVLKYAQSNVVGAPVITMPPRAALWAANASTMFRCGPRAREPLNYQWLRGRTPVPAVRKPTLSSLPPPIRSQAITASKFETIWDSLSVPAAELRVRGPVVPELSGGVSDGMLRIILLGRGRFQLSRRRIIRLAYLGACLYELQPEQQHCNH
jgi:hypothetical protein